MICDKISKVKKGGDRMSEFWYTKTTMDKLNPDYIRFEHFSPLHLFVTAVFFAIIICAMVFYRRLDEKGRQKFLYIMSALLIADELWKHILSAATGQWEWEFIPLHLCSINIFVCVINSFRRDKLTSEILYALCVPGALLALLMPTWTNLPYWNFMSLHSNSVHVLLAMYPLLLIAGGFKPNFRRLPKVLLLLLCESVPIYFLNKVLGHRGSTVQHDGEAGQTLGALFQHVEAELGLGAGLELVSAVRGADGDGQGVTAGAGNELFQEAASEETLTSSSMPAREPSSASTTTPWS